VHKEPKKFVKLTEVVTLADGSEKKYEKEFFTKKSCIRAFQRYGLPTWAIYELKKYSETSLTLEGSKRVFKIEDILTQ